MSIRWTNEELTLLVTMYRKGVRYEDMVPKLRWRSEGMIRRKVRAMGLAYRRRPITETIKRVRKFHAQGMNDAEIAEKTGLSQRMVQRARSRAGLPRNPTRGERCRIASRKQWEDGRDPCSKARMRMIREGWPAGTTEGMAVVLGVVESGPEQGVTVKDVAAVTGKGYTTLTEMMRTLRDIGALQRDDRGRHTLTPEVVESRRRSRLKTG